MKSLRIFKGPINNVLSSLTRGAKKKGDKKSDVVLSEHILNFKKVGEDVKVLPDAFYPPWVLDLAREPTNYNDMIVQLTLGTMVFISIDLVTASPGYENYFKEE